jgi:hypothetical protein
MNILRTGIACLAWWASVQSCVLRAGPLLLHDEWMPAHQQGIAVKYVNRVLTPGQQDWPQARFTVSSPDDPAYATPVAAVSASYWVRPERYSIRRPINIKHTWVYLQLPSPLKAGCTYVVHEDALSWQGLAIATGEPIAENVNRTPDVSGVWQGDRQHHSQSIKINQVGYKPSAQKRGYLSQFAGYADATRHTPVDVDFSAFGAFEILDDTTGKTMWTGTVSSASNKRDPLSQSRVWTLDFSAFETPGRYRLHVPGVGVSYPFHIADDVFNHAFGVLMRGVYHQRCGVALERPWTRHTHPVCHYDDGRVPSFDAYQKPSLDFIPQQEGATFPCARGHHDAGDYGKYTVNGALFAYSILQAFEVYPEQLLYDHSPVPEAGNGIPDLLEEVKWELDWLQGMQDPEDGAVHIIVKPDPTMSYEDGVSGLPSGRFDKPRTLWWKDIHATAAFAAIMARAARTPGLQQHWPTESRQYLSQARKAWAFCMTRTQADGAPQPRVGGHHYGNFLEAKDEYAWMAVELWLTTGEKEYHDYFLRHHDPDETWNWNWWPLKDAAGAATRSYVYGRRTGKDETMLARCRSGGHGVLDAARATLSWQDRWITKHSFSPQAYSFGRWGWYFLSDIASYDLLLAASLVDENERNRFVQAALFNADQELGNTADNRSMITGIGARRPVDIVHQNARFDGIVEPVPGIPLGIHPAGFNRGTSDRALMARYLVDELPIAYRYVDAWNIEQEFTVDVLSRTLMTYAMLGHAENQKSGFPNLVIHANGNKTSVEGEAPFPVSFRADGQGSNSKSIREYYWDIGNEEFFSGDAFQYTFTAPGLYTVVCTATDDAGWPAFAQVNVRVREPVHQLPNGGKGWNVNPHTYGVWRFDGRLDDDIHNRYAELTGSAFMTGENIMWMATPKGQAVRVKHADDGIRIPLGPLFESPDVIALDVQAMIQYENDVPRGKGHSRLFMIYGHWDAQWGVQKDSWAGKQLRGVPSDRQDAIPSQDAILDTLAPQPGWRHLHMRLDRNKGKAFVALDANKIEWPFIVSKTQRDMALYIGGFTGYVDEVRIDIIRETDSL